MRKRFSGSKLRSSQDYCHIKCIIISSSILDPFSFLPHRPLNWPFYEKGTPPPQFCHHLSQREKSRPSSSSRAQASLSVCAGSDTLAAHPLPTTHQSLSHWGGDKKLPRASPAHWKPYSVTCDLCCWELLPNLQASLSLFLSRNSSRQPAANDSDFRSLFFSQGHSDHTATVRR